MKKVIISLILVSKTIGQDIYDIPEKIIPKRPESHLSGDHYFYDRTKRKPQIASKIKIHDHEYELVFMGLGKMQLIKLIDNAKTPIVNFQNYSTANLLLLDVAANGDGGIDVLVTSIGLGYEIYRFTKNGSNYKSIFWINVLCPGGYPQFANRIHTFGIKNGTMFINFAGEKQIELPLEEESGTVKVITNEDSTKKINILYTKLDK